MSHFRLQGKYFFLTYPKSDFDLDDYAADFCSRGSIRSLIVCSERHADDTLHRHCAIEYETRKDIRSERYFDYLGFHPNIQTCRSFADVCEYISKDGEFVTYPEDLDWSTKEKEDLSEPGSFQTETDWIQYCLGRKIPYGYCARMWFLSRKDRGNTILDEPSGTLCKELADYDFSKDIFSWVIIGGSGIGKTTWALKFCIKPSLFVTHMDNLRKFDKDYHKSIIFDDMDFKHMPLTAQIHLVDYEMPRTIHARYNCAEIPARTYKFFTCNEMPFSDHEAIERRIELISIK